MELWPQVLFTFVRFGKRGNWEGSKWRGSLTTGRAPGLKFATVATVVGVRAVWSGYLKHREECLEVKSLGAEELKGDGIEMSQSCGYAVLHWNALARMWQVGACSRQLKCSGTCPPPYHSLTDQVPRQWPALWDPPVATCVNRLTAQCKVVTNLLFLSCQTYGGSKVN